MDSEGRKRVGRKGRFEGGVEHCRGSNPDGVSGLLDTPAVIGSFQSRHSMESQDVTSQVTKLHWNLGPSAVTELFGDTFTLP